MRLTAQELAFVDRLGRHYAKQYGVPPATGRVIGWLLICEPPQQTAAAIAEALGISRSAVGGAVTMLETWGAVEKTRQPGERADRVVVVGGFGSDGLARVDEYETLANFAREGLELLAGASEQQRARLLEMAAFAEFLIERLPQLADEWAVKRDEMRAAGALPREDWS
ncbi:MarR family transcriptional regulator [Conexibacter sp. JD483]|uniref:GbsR/MarR family transcriptional regulator n=1 Tax=unclassified Conexibacter TaxID=2627773 RepID=UPI002722D0DA|nr:MULTISPECIES: MarR family transcriptional regulator [unclassified Conexibacter]MDO8186935.1 MarR family transcriptional regulator [Conexibacter sp. CPCC 205706]MDO8200610.1 MarR family transcriptional regulator [Conexibacter sp. CPCC 205762]MDR9368812.1 MarR family transcriptional regulator [Conexibacter sp. JD483]